jgi:hypothetical protein
MRAQIVPPNADKNLFTRSEQDKTPPGQAALEVQLITKCISHERLFAVHARAVFPPAP